MVLRSETKERIPSVYNVSETLCGEGGYISCFGHEGCLRVAMMVWICRGLARGPILFNRHLDFAK
jgi:hypothetical protein